MTNKTKTISRHGQTRTVTNNGHGWFTIEGESLYSRAGLAEDNSTIDYIDFEGGPLLRIGDNFQGQGKIVSLHPETNQTKDYFKVRIEVEQV